MVQVAEFAVRNALALPTRLSVPSGPVYLQVMLKKTLFLTMRIKSHNNQTVTHSLSWIVMSALPISRLASLSSS